MVRTAVRAAKVYAAVPGPALHDAVVLVEDGVVIGVMPARETPADARVVDLGDTTVLPGFIDAHVHLALAATADAPAAVLGVPRHELVERMLANARTLLASGVTTARDLGAPLEASLAAREALASEGGLRLLIAGAPVTAPGAHLHFFGGGVSGPRAAEELVRKQVDAGVDWIKLVLSGGEITPGSHLRDCALPDAGAWAAVAAARASGVPVAVHAHTGTAAALAVELGVDTVEHCTLLDSDGPPVAPRIVCPTANVRWRSAELDVRRARAARLATLRAGGTTLVAGTDAGIPGVGFGAYADGLLALQEAGLTSEQVIHAATTGAARALGLPRVGVLRPGSLADLVALPADPLNDLAAVAAPTAVFIGGRQVSVS